MRISIDMFSLLPLRKISGSGWSDYYRSLISDGGGVFYRFAKPLKSMTVAHCKYWKFVDAGISAWPYTIGAMAFSNGLSIFYDIFDRPGLLKNKSHIKGESRARLSNTLKVRAPQRLA